MPDSTGRQTTPSEGADVSGSRHAGFIWTKRDGGGLVVPPHAAADCGTLWGCQEALDNPLCQVHPDSMPTTPEVQEGLDAITKAVEDVKASDRALRFLVMTTKLQGATWQQIGDVLGVTRQAAQERFGKDVEA